MHRLLPLLVVGAILILVVNIFKASGLKIGAAPLIDDTPQTRSVLLLIFDPILENQGGKKVTQYFNWSDPDAITAQLLERFPVITKGYLTYNVSERQEIDGYFVKQSGYEFTDESFLSCMQGRTTCNGELINYQKLFTDFDICNKNVDEVWLWGGPWFGYHEFEPVSFCGKTQFVMGFNYERRFDEAIHDFGHRMEFVANNRVGTGNWQQDESNDWNKFSLIAGHCGNVHYPPGSSVPSDEYIYNKTTAVTTDCEGYLNYPEGPFVDTTLTCSAWGCTQGGYISWWLSHIPSNSGTTTSINFKTIYNNWWKYYAFYDETASPLPSPSGTARPTPQISFSNLSSTLVPGRSTFYFDYSGPTSNFVVDMSLRPDMSWDTYLTFAQGNTNPIIETNPEKWDRYTCGTQFYWVVKNNYGTSAIKPAVVDCGQTVPTLSPRPSPTPTISPTPPANSVTLYPVADTFVSNEQGKSQLNFGTQNTLEVMGNPDKTTYMKFDLSSIASKLVVNATLYIKVVDASNANQNIKQTSSNWSENSLTYTNKPRLTTKITSFTEKTYGVWKTIDITQFIKSNKGNIVSFGIDSSGRDGFGFASRESTDRPYIVIK